LFSAIGGGRLEPLAALKFRVQALACFGETTFRLRRNSNLLSAPKDFKYPWQALACLLAT
jgi:hypothetical protein